MPKLANINYRCPSCSAIISVHAEFVGKQVDCPSCSLPFLAKAPEADPLLDRDENAEPAQFEVDKPTDDELVLEVIHPAMLRQQPITFLLLMTIVIVAVPTGLYTAVIGVPIVSGLAFLALLAIGVYFAYSYFFVLATQLKITNKRTVLRHGLISKSTTEVQHDDIRNLQVDQNIVQRILDVGDLAISSSGQDDLEIRIKSIPDPGDIADRIRSLQ